MAHKKHERKKELDRRRKRRKEATKLRIKEAIAAKNAQFFYDKLSTAYRFDNVFSLHLQA